MRDDVVRDPSIPAVTFHSPLGAFSRRRALSEQSMCIPVKYAISTPFDTSLGKL